MVKDKKVKTKQIKVVSVRPEGSRRVYANYAEVTASVLDISIRFADVKPPTNPSEARHIRETGIIKVPVDVEIAMPKEVALALAKALAGQLSQVDKERGE